MFYNFTWKSNPHQKEFLKDIESRLLHLSTGFGGGKTHALCIKALQLSRLNAPYPGGLVGPDFKELKKDVIPEMELVLEKNGIPYYHHKTEHYFKFPWTRGPLYLVSGDKKIRGPNWAYALINELTLIPLVRYKEIMGRVRVKGAKCPQIASCGTPEGFASEYYEYMIENPPKSLKIIYGSTDDNIENLHESYLDLLEDSYDKKMLDAYRRGLWVNMAGNLFYYSYDPKKVNDLEIEPNLFDRYHISMDFNVDPMTCTMWGLDNNMGGTLYGCDQIELKGAEGYNTQNICDRLKAMGYTGNNSTIYPDPAGRARSTKGPPDVKILHDNGFPVRVKNAAPSFRRRQLNTNNLLDKGRVRINPKRCPGIIRDFQGVEQDIITLEKKKDSPNLTHFSDGFDYMTDILFPFSGDLKGLREVKIR